MKKISTRLTVIFVLAAGAIGLFLVHLYSLDGITGFVFPLFYKEDTIYAAGYRNVLFRRIHVGMNGEDVLKCLGEPLDRSFCKDADTESWRYSKSASDRSYRIRAVEFQNSKVVNVYHEFYLD